MAAASTFIPVDFGPPITSDRELRLAIYDFYRQWVGAKDEMLWSEGGKKPAAVQCFRDILTKYPNPPPPQSELVSIVKMLLGVEKMLPDYVRVIAELVRSDFRVMFLYYWAGEEQMHSCALEEWLQYAAEYTPEQILDLHDTHLLQNSWDPRRQNVHFANPWYGSAYTNWQELITALVYRALASYAKRVGQPALAEICNRLVYEEMRHHKFYEGVCRLSYRRNPPLSQQMILLAHQEFRMPGDYIQLPGYHRATLHAMHEGVFPIHPENERVRSRFASKQKVVTLEEQVREHARETCLQAFTRGCQTVFNTFGIPCPPNTQLLPGSALIAT